MTSQLYVLYEHASGYALFHVQEVEDIGALLPTVEKAITDFSLFASTVKLVAFSPFKSSTNALDNINAVSEGILHDDLKLFLQTNVPKNKKGNVQLGIGDTRISATIQEETGIKCSNIEVVAEILRGLRVHFPNMVKGLTMQAEAKAQLGLSHSYSRAKVKFNVNRADNMIIQSIALLDQLDKDINTFSMRVKEWYSYHFPELSKVCSDNYMYCKLAKLLGNRKSLPEDIEAKLEEVIMDSSKAQAILSASKMSMGMDVSPIDLINIESFCSRVISLTDYRKSLVEYLHKRMQSVAPNLSTLIGDVVGARLISHAGSLTSLAKYPASTVQILGAEKALFRALKSRGNTPKYGLIFHSTFIGRAGSKNKGRISRYLANKCSIASRIDCFTEHPNTVFGQKLRDQVEERLKFYESGEAPRKNADVMKEAVLEASAFVEAQKEEHDAINLDESMKKKKKKKRKTEPEVLNDEPEVKKTKADEEAAPVETKTPKSDKKKKKKREVSLNQSEVVMEDDAPKSEKKKKKKKSIVSDAVGDGSAEAELEEEKMVISGEKQSSIIQSEEPKSEKKKKKKKKDQQSEEINESVAEPESTPVTTETPKKKKKKDKSILSENAEQLEVEASATKKKKKKKNDASQAAGNDDVNNEEKKPKEEDINTSVINENGDVETKAKKKKKRKSLNESAVSEKGAEENVNAVKTKKKKKIVA
ncbi:nucleolar protein 56-like [Clavelina lepadiformis]|uniref:nucleolar protein 56-like n=1 Tax=Clavelina lepadiformis TaxID=159417 RepID=UPI0040419765